MAVLPATGLTIQSVKQGCDDPKAVMVPLDFSTATSFTLDMLPLIQNGSIDFVLTIFVDNKLNPNNDVNVLLSGTQQTISAPGGTQGYYAVLLNTPPQIRFTCAGGHAVLVSLMNFIVSGVVWTPKNA